MAAIPISKSITRATDRLEFVLSHLLPGYLEERCEEGYPLPRPEVWVTARIDLERHWRALNIHEVLGTITPRGQTTVDGRYSGDGEKWSRTQRARYEASVIIKGPMSYPAVERNGRTLLEPEWLFHRAELYRGAVVDVVTRYAPESQHIHDVEIESYEADVFEIPNFGAFSHATIRFAIFQDVLIDG